MDELNMNLCSILQEITDYNIESVTEMDQGFLLANLLEQIDHDEFKSRDKTLNNWANAKDRLEHFLETKGLVNQNLDFELAEIRKGDVQAIVSALLQMLAIFAAFNPSNWDRILNRVDYMAKISVMKFLESMVADIKDEMKYANKSSKHVSLEKAEDIKALLQKLEKHESTIDSQNQQITDLKLDLEKEQSEKGRLNKVVEEKDREIAEMQQIKNEALKLLESNYASHREDDNSEDHIKKIAKLNQEVDKLNERLMECRSQLIDKDNEIEKMKIMQQFLEEKKTELEATNEQLEHYKRQADKLKKANDVAEAKVKTLELAERNISRFKLLLKEEKQNSVSMKVKLSEYELTIASLQRKLGNTEDKFTIMRKSMVQASSIENNEIAYQSTYMRDLEYENTKLKEQVSTLISRQNDIEIKNLIDDMKDKENEAFRSQMKSLLIENDHLTAIQKQEKQETYLKSKASIDPVDFELNGMMQTRELNESFTFETHHQDLDTFWNVKPEDIGANVSPFRMEDFGLIYTSIMSYAYRDLLKQRLLVPGREDRQRDILKPFAITNLLGPEKSNLI